MSMVWLSASKIETGLSVFTRFGPIAAGQEGRLSTQTGLFDVPESGQKRTRRHPPDAAHTASTRGLLIICSIDRFNPYSIVGREGIDRLGFSVHRRSNTAHFVATL